MRAAFVVLSALALAGCGASEADIDKKVAKEVERRLAEAKKAEAKETPKPSAAEAARDKSTLRADIRDARSVVLDRMSAVKRQTGGGTGAYRFEVEITNLDGVSWDWSERELIARENAEGDANGRADEIEYSVDPRELSSVVVATYQGMPAVRFNCASGKCITARGERRTANDGDLKDRKVAERRAYNVWAVPDRNDARRVADALDRIVAAAKEL